MPTEPAVTNDSGLVEPMTIMSGTGRKNAPASGSAQNRTSQVGIHHAPCPSA
jgi:hypothetical protein